MEVGRGLGCRKVRGSWLLTEVPTWECGRGSLTLCGQDPQSPLWRQRCPVSVTRLPQALPGRLCRTPSQSSLVVPTHTQPPYLWPFLHVLPSQ